MSALMPETNRKNCVDPTVFPMRRQNTGNQTHANASTRAAQLTANIPILITKSNTICSCGNFLARQDIYARSGEIGPLIVHTLELTNLTVNLGCIFLCQHTWHNYPTLTWCPQSEP